MSVEDMQVLWDELRLWVEQAALVEEEAAKFGFQPSKSANGDTEEEERKRAALESKCQAAEENLCAQKSSAAAKGSEVGVVRVLSDYLVTGTTFVLPHRWGIETRSRELDASKYRYFWPGTREAYSHAAANINLGELELELVITTPCANSRILPTLASIRTQRCSNCTGVHTDSPSSYTLFWF
ncbi:hypothetical protein BT69DRAFT_1339675 [Atractiella rhizophila]|nr:hypothetical protein BT69DRAFT_1339675 [Atractiella rhizophila]